MRAPLTIAITLTLLQMSTGSCLADPNVVVSAFASPEYTRVKYGAEKPRAETYVVMQGSFFEGQSVDKSIDRLPFRRILDFFAPELARREYWPAKNAGDADLLIIVHWGTTTRMVSSNEMRARDSAITDISTSSEVLARNAMVDQYSGGDQAGLGVLLSASDPVAHQLSLDNLDIVSEQARSDRGLATNAQLLGYSRELRQLGSSLAVSTAETTLRADLTGERYFVILKAYDLHAKVPAGQDRRAVWTLHLNVRSPGTNFQSALDRMSATAVNYFGRATDSVTTVRPHEHEGKVEVGTPIVVGEKKK